MIKTTVAVPICERHLNYKDNVINDFCYNQSKRPDVLLLSICGIDSQDTVQDVNGVVVKTIFHKDNIVTGSHRNILYSLAEDGIVIFSDADDLSHRQRVEIIENVFSSHPDIDYIVHNYAKNAIHEIEAAITPDQLRVQLHKDMADFATGVPALKKPNIDAAWPPKTYAEDWEFCVNLLKEYSGRGLIIGNKLYHYNFTSHSY